MKRSVALFFSRSSWMIILHALRFRFVANGLGAFQVFSQLTCKRIKWLCYECELIENEWGYRRRSTGIYSMFGSRKQEKKEITMQNVMSYMGVKYPVTQIFPDELPISHENIPDGTTHFYVIMLQTAHHDKYVKIKKMRPTQPCYRCSFSSYAKL